MEDKNSLAWDLIQDRNLIIDKLIKALIIVIIISAILVTTITGMFIWYLNQYDFSGTVETSTVEAYSYENGSATAILNDNGEVTLNGEGESIYNEEN